MHLLSVHKREEIVYWGSMGAIVLSSLVPSLCFFSTSLNPYGFLVSIASTSLALPIVAFASNFQNFFLSNFKLKPKKEDIYTENTSLKDFRC